MYKEHWAHSLGRHPHEKHEARQRPPAQAPNGPRANAPITRSESPRSAAGSGGGEDPEDHRYPQQSEHQRDIPSMEQVRTSATQISPAVALMLGTVDSMREQVAMEAAHMASKYRKTRQLDKAYNAYMEYMQQQWRQYMTTRASHHELQQLSSRQRQHGNKHTKASRTKASRTRPQSRSQRTNERTNDTSGAEESNNSSNGGRLPRLPHSQPSSAPANKTNRQIHQMHRALLAAYIRTHQDTSTPMFHRHIRQFNQCMPTWLTAARDSSRHHDNNLATATTLALTQSTRGRLQPRRTQTNMAASTNIYLRMRQLHRALLAAYVQTHRITATPMFRTHLHQFNRRMPIWLHSALTSRKRRITDTSQATSAPSKSARATNRLAGRQTHSATVSRRPRTKGDLRRQIQARRQMRRPFPLTRAPPIPVHQLPRRMRLDRDIRECAANAASLSMLLRRPIDDVDRRFIRYMTILHGRRPQSPQPPPLPRQQPRSANPATHADANPATNTNTSPAPQTNANPAANPDPNPADRDDGNTSGSDNSDIHTL